MLFASWAADSGAVVTPGRSRGLRRRLAGEGSSRQALLGFVEIGTEIEPVIEAGGGKDPADE